VHRLDRDSSGIVVFAKSAQAKRLVMASRAKTSSHVGD